MERITIGVQGMSCDHCKRAVEEELTGVDGVAGAFADLEAASVTVDYDPGKVTVAVLRGAIEEAGYEAR